MLLGNFEEAAARGIVIDDRAGVIGAQPQARRGQRRWRREPRGMDVPGLEARQFGHPGAYVRAFGVEFLALGDRIEDAEPGLRVATAAGRPLPARVVVRPVSVG